MTRKERLETLGHPATRFTNIYVKNFAEAQISDEEFEAVSLLIQNHNNILMIMAY